MKRALSMVSIQAISLMFLPAAAFAQASPAPEVADNEIIVTAQRRSETLVNVPIAIAAVNAAKLQDSGVKDFASLQQVVPGLQVTFAAGNTQPVLRGVGTQVASAGLPANIATYIDGFYRPIQLTTNVPFDGVDQIEVLKGPQGTLYGRNATGGAILITTKGPKFEPDAQFHLSFGNYNDAIASSYVTTGVGDQLAVSAFGYLNYSKGYIKNIASGRDDDNHTVLVRLKARYEPTEQLRVDLSFEYTSVNDPSATTLMPYKGQVVPALIPGATFGVKPRQYAADLPNIYRTDAYGFFMKVGYEFDGATLTSLTGYEYQNGTRQADFDFSALPLLHVHYPQREAVLQQEFDLVSATDGPFQWSVGGSYLQSKPKQLPVDVINFNPVLLSVKGRQTQDSIAFYGEGTYDIGDHLSITAGARYSHDKFKAVTNGLPTYVDVFGKDTQKALTPRVALRYKIDPRTQIYASFNKGYKAGGFNTVAVSPTAVRPEKIDAYEVGVKVDRQAFNFQAATYLYNYKDIQVNAYQGITNVLINAAKARIYGAEAHLGYKASDALSIDLAASYVHARYRSFPTAVFYAWSPVLGVTVAQADAKGNPLPVSPDFTASIGFTYKQPVGDGQFKLSGSASYSSRVYFDPFKQVSQSAYEQLNFRAAYEAQGGKWELGAYLQNATDKDYYKSAVLQQTGFGVQYGAPLRFGIDFILRPFK